jgi:hypothetical protein
MKKCIHECENCDETWVCSYPYYSKFKFFKNTVNNGYYCNSYCPTCQQEDREEIDDLFNSLSETGYIKSFEEQYLRI